MTLHYTRPVELADLSTSLGALAHQHERFADKLGATINGDRIRLYVKEIRPGSIIVELLALAQTELPLVDAVNTVVPFAKNVSELLGFAVGRTPAPPDGTTPKDARDLSEFIKPVAGDLGSSMVIQARDNARVEVNVHIDSNQANAAQNRLGNWAARQQEPVSGIHEHQLFYFARATGDAQRGTGDRGIIERFGNASRQDPVHDGGGSQAAPSPGAPVPKSLRCRRGRPNRGWEADALPDPESSRQLQPEYRAGQDRVLIPLVELG